MSNGKRSHDNSDEQNSEQQATKTRHDLFFGNLSSLSMQLNSTNHYLTPPSGRSSAELRESRNTSVSQAYSQTSSDNDSASVPITMPCGARGMPPDHDVQNAYFTVFKGTKHGEELICSHPLCRSGGVKFCYCAHCNMPVAKRNFRIRHHHSDEPITTQPSTTLEDVIQYGRMNQLGGSSQGERRPSSSRDDFQADLLHRADGITEHQESARNTVTYNFLAGLLGLQGNLAANNINPHSAIQPANSRDKETSNSDHTIHYQSVSHGEKATTSQSPNHSSQETNEVGKNVTRFPCKARGMPPEHNSKTAYFDVSDHIKHGDELVCSFPGCRNAGVKFCFCTHCRIPVAKRNFRIRHNHCDYAPPAPCVVESLRGAALPMGLSASGKTARLSESLTKIETGRRDLAGLPSPASSFTTNKKRKGRARSLHLTPSPVASLPPAKPTNKPIEHHNGSASESGGSPVSDDEDEITLERMAAWDKLLERRPRSIESGEMSTWLLSVLAVSNMEIPVEPTNPPPPQHAPRIGSSGRTSLDSDQENDVDDDIKLGKRLKR